MAKFKCKVCEHALGKQMEKEFIIGDTVYAISKKYGINYGTVSRHMKNHLPQTLVNDRKLRMPELALAPVKMEDAIPSLSSLQDCIEYIHNKTLNIHQQAEKDEDYNLSLRALRSDLDCVSLVMRATELMFGHERQENWEKTLTVILSVLSEHKEAKEAVSSALYNYFGGDDFLKSLSP